MLGFEEASKAQLLRGSSTMHVLFSALMMVSIILLEHPAIALADSCQAAISTCGCTITVGGFYSVMSNLSTAAAGADCIDIKAPNVKLWIDGVSITGAGGGIGIHLLKSAAGAFIEGLNLGSGSFSSVGSFHIGIQDDANGATIAHVDTSGNSNAGVLLNRVNGSLISDFSADSNAYGVELFAST